MVKFGWRLWMTFVFALLLIMIVFSSSLQHQGILLIAFMIYVLTTLPFLHMDLATAWSKWWTIGTDNRWVWYQQQHALQARVHIAFIFLGLLMLFLAYQLVFRRRLQPSISQGSARWAGRQDISAYRKSIWPSFVTKWLIPSKDETFSSLFILGKTAQGATIRLTEKQQESHIVLTASTGGGKTSAIIIPNILNERGNRSFFATNPKGDLYDLTSGAASRFHEIWHLCPENVAQSAQYDPLAEIHTLEDAQNFAEIWVSNTGRSNNEPYWDREAEQLITMLAIHVRTSDPDAHFPKLIEILYEPYGVMKATLLNSKSDEARLLAQRAFSVWDADPKIRATIMGDVATRFRSFLSKSIQQMTSGNTINFVEMAKRPIGLYLTVLPSEAERLKPFTACFISQMFRAWSRYATQQPDHALPHGIMCYMDEFANCGKIPSIVQYVSMMRSQRVGLTMAIQSIQQLDEIYGEHVSKTILNNAKTHLVFSGIGLEDAEYYSKRIGNTTVVVANQSEQGFAHRGYGLSEGSRALITPDEIRTLSRNEMIVIPEREPPIRVRTLPYYNNPSQIILTKLPPPTYKRKEKRTVTGGIPSQK